MVVTTSLAFIVVRYLWKWRLWTSVAFIAPFLLLDVTFLAANALKIVSGGWVPLLIGGSLFTVMATWVRGAQILTDKARRDSVALSELTEILRARAPHRVPGAAIFLTSDPDMAPVALMCTTSSDNKVLHEKNVILHPCATTETPRVDDADSRLEYRCDQRRLPRRSRSPLRLHGKPEHPQGPGPLCRKQGLKFDIMATSFFLGRRSVRAPRPIRGCRCGRTSFSSSLMKNAGQSDGVFQDPAGARRGTRHPGYRITVSDSECGGSAFRCWIGPPTAARRRRLGRPGPDRHGDLFRCAPGGGWTREAWAPLQWGPDGSPTLRAAQRDLAVGFTPMAAMAGGSADGGRRATGRRCAGPG